MAAIFLILLMVQIPRQVKEFEECKGLKYVYWIILAGHELVAFTNSNFFTVIGAHMDAARSHHNAVELSRGGEFYLGVGVVFYENALGFIYSLFGPSLFLGCQISILFFSVSCIVFIKILKLLEITSSRAFLLFLYGGLPSVVFFGSVTLRESFESVLFMLVVYFTLRIAFSSMKLLDYLSALISAFAMGVMHNGLFIYSIGAIILIFSIFLKKILFRQTKKYMALGLVACVLTGAFTLSIIYVGVAPDRGANTIKALMHGGLMEYVADYRVKNIDIYHGRTTYGGYLDTASAPAVGWGIINIYKNYQLRPFFWEITNLVDAYAFFEVVLRMVLLYYSMRLWRRASGRRRASYGLLLFFYISMTFMWAMGTTNYGTALRHHVITSWILVVLGGASMQKALIERLSQIGSGLRERGKSLFLKK
ncbi:hypothetical protein OAJ79_01425 [Verrucomicrobia bacterium]|nr:hypothetical protein [Verrucomicrobiota bacterium]